MKLISFLLILLILFWGCKKKNKESVINTVDSQRVQDSIDSTYYQVREFHKTISINVFEKRDITIKNPENYFEVLLALFPGMIAVDSTYDEPFEDSAVTWLTKNHPEKKVWDPFWPNDSIDFPFKEGNETQFEDLFYYTSKGEKYCAFFYSTYSCYYPWLFERYNKYADPVWGISIFKKTMAGWKLDIHEPAFGCFAMGSEFEKVLLSFNKIGFILKNSARGPGVFTQDILVFKINTPLTLVLHEKSFANSEGYNNWSYNIFKPSKSNPSLTLTANGVIALAGLDTFITKRLDSMLTKALDKDSVYKFTYSKTYAPDSIGNYRLHKTSLKKKYTKIRTHY